MASAKLQRAMAADEDEMKMDMSPMIDLVFLLLIFFMVSSHMIITKIDPEVKPPTAAEAVVAKNNEGRIVVNIYEDGTFRGPELGMNFLTADFKSLQSNPGIFVIATEITCSIEALATCNLC